MKYTVVINQLAFQRHFPELDIVDAAIFDYISQFMLSKGIERLDDELGRWYWVSYKKIATDLPIIGIKSPDAIYRRVKKLIDEDLLETHPDNQSKNRSYFKQGDNFDLINFVPPDEKPNPRMNNGGTPGQKTEGPPDEETDDTIIRDTNISDEVISSSLQEEVENSIESVILKRQTEAKRSLSDSIAAKQKYQDAIEIELHLLSRIIKNDPDHKYAKRAPGITSSVKELERALRIDGRTKKQLLYIIDYLYTQTTEQAMFWRPNIESGTKLREKFDTLKNKIVQEVNAKKGKSTQQIVNQAKSAVDRLDFEE